MNATDIAEDGRTLVDALLAEQRSLTAVERFSLAHDAAPSQAKFYRNLIPLTAPAPGQQYGFEVDLDKCSACKACVTACHALNGLDDDETWRDVGLLHNDDWRAPFQANVTTACHHCVDPACLSGCPVLAYDKDPVTGIVRHLDDQCIGCQYCVMKCPYEVPQYSAKRGIVRKCDMCSNRLSHGEAPACVQACPSVAIRITLVDQREISIQFREQAAANSTSQENSFLPASPAPNYTVPTTRYKSARPLPANLFAGDKSRIAPACSHLPLVFMLVLSQLAVGASTAALFTSSPKWLTLAATIIGSLALGIGSLHLGQPLKAWRAFLGWRNSWFSREVIVFGGYIPLACFAAVACWFSTLANFRLTLGIFASATGLLGVGCSAMIYADTRREYWRPSQSFGKFFGTVLLLGTELLLLQATRNYATYLGCLIGITVIVKLAFEHRVLRQLTDAEIPTSLDKTARLLTGELGRIARTRMGLGVIGGIILPLPFVFGTISDPTQASCLAAAILGVSLAGELLERYLFFTAVAPEKMPGGLAA